MTTIAPETPLLPEERPSWYDRWAARMRADPMLSRRYARAAPLFVTLLAAILRLWRLDVPHALVFDETYYVKDAWSQWNLGYPGSWPADADTKFVSGLTDVFSTVGSYAVHPPLGKWIIGLGMALFGSDSSFGWRVGTAVCGTAMVLLLYVVARRLTGSTLFATVAGLLLAIDGLAIVMSRVALLDIFLSFFVLLAFWFVLLDRDRQLARVAQAVAARTVGGEPPAWGPLLWGRPWLLAAGAALGAAMAVKWSGVYVIAAVGIYAVVTDALARRRAGVRFWPMDAARQGVAAAILLLPVAFIVYLASWTGWLVTAGGYDRSIVAASPATGFWSWVPQPLQNLWAYHEAMYAFHVGLDTPHSYASPAWEWPFLLRPTSMYWQEGPGGIQGGVRAISSIPNPLIWYGAVAATVAIVVLLFLRRDGRYGFVLTGVAATYVPWLLYPDRTIFQFYTIAILPFLVLALTLGLQLIAGSPGASPQRRMSGQRVVMVFLIVAVVLSAFWYPVWTGMHVPYDFWRLHNWIPRWV